MRVRQVVSVGAGVGLIAGLAVGCAAKNPAPYPDVQSFCNAKAQAECQVASTCLITDVSACQAQRASVCNADADAATANGTGMRKYTQANAQKCIDDLNAAYGGGNQQVTFAQLGTITNDCERVFVGNSAMNQPCESSYDCTGDLICAPVTPGTATAGMGPSVCAASVPKNSGDFCSTPGATCPTDTYCATPSASSAPTCQPAKGQGEACDPPAMPCVSTQRCQAIGATGMTCEPRSTMGQACQTDGDCVPDAPYCDRYVGKCTKGQSFATGAADCMEFTATGAMPTVSVSDAGGD
jgi:hypothetical protein